MLSDAQVRQFWQQGYLIVEEIIDQEALRCVHDEYINLMDELYDGWQMRGLVEPAKQGMSFWNKLDRCYQAGFDWYQPFDISLPHDNIREDTPMHFGPGVFNLLTHENILDVVESLIGPEITSNPIQHVRIKPPQRAVPKSETRAHVVSTDWHQDKGVTLEEADETEFVTVWLAMTDATVANGCLQVATGQFEQLLPHCSKTQVSIADQFVPAGSATPVPVKAGGAVVFHPLTPHASLTNKSDEYRWSFDLRYNVTGQPTGRSHFPEFIARSRCNPSLELRDWRGWQRMWQETRSTLAASPHIAQHRWDATSPFCA